MNRRLFLSILAVASVGVWVGMRSFDDSGTNDRRARFEAWSKAHKAAYRTWVDRSIERSKFLEKPEVRASWVQLAHDRMAASPSEDFLVHDIGKARFRGIPLQSVEDRRSGDQLQILSGDMADHYGSGLLRLAKSSEPIKIEFEWDQEPGGQLVIAVDRHTWRTRAKSGPGRLREVAPYLNDAAMMTLAHLFNCGDRKFYFTPNLRNGPILIDRRKPQYAGVAGLEAYVKDREAFLDRMVDELYVNRGIDPSTGKLDPGDIPPYGWKVIRQRRKI